MKTIAERRAYRAALPREDKARSRQEAAERRQRELDRRTHIEAIAAVVSERVRAVLDEPPAPPAPESTVSRRLERLRDAFVRVGG